VQGTYHDTSVTINTGGGNDKVKVGLQVDSNEFLSYVLAAVAGPLTVHADGGDEDLLWLRDTGTSAGQDYSISATTVLRSGVAAITYDGVENLTVSAGGHDDVFRVSGTSAATTLNAGLGNDEVRVGKVVGFGGYTLDAIQGELTVYGGGGRATDELLLRDTAADEGHHYTITATTVKRQDAALVTYYGIEDLTVTAGGHDDTFFVSDTGAATAVTLNGLGADDRFIRARSASSRRFRSTGSLAVSINGGSGSEDALFLHDQASAPARLHADRRQRDLGRWDNDHLRRR
jgi:acrosin